MFRLLRALLLLPLCNVFCGQVEEKCSFTSLLGTVQQEEPPQDPHLGGFSSSLTAAGGLIAFTEQITGGLVDIVRIVDHQGTVVFRFPNATAVALFHNSRSSTAIIGEEGATYVAVAFHGNETFLPDSNSCPQDISCAELVRVYAIQRNSTAGNLVLRPVGNRISVEIRGDIPNVLQLATTGTDLILVARTSARAFRIYFLDSNNSIWARLCADVPGASDAMVVAKRRGQRVVTSNGNWMERNGRIWIYDYSPDATVWELQQELDAIATGDSFGRSVSIVDDGKVVAVGTYRAAKVEVLVEIDGVWNRQYILTPRDSLPIDDFGYEICHFW